MIKITSLDPAKNSKNVNVNKDLIIKVNADFKLDPRDVYFKLNSVDVVPNIFSVYHGETSCDLIITLYTKRRVKYGSEYKYGQEDLRYGMRDDRPSMLEYASRYVCEFSVWGTNQAGIKEEITDSFVFNTEEGIFYNQNPSTYFYSEATQGIANYFPEWSKTRYDKYSNLQQLLNPIGEGLEQAQDFTKASLQNYFIQTANMNELSKLYKVELDKDFEIKSILNEDGTFFYIPPSISGVQSITRFDLFTTQENTLKSFYTNRLPTRIDAIRDDVGSNVLISRREVMEIKESVGVDLGREGTICINIWGLDSSIIKTVTNTIVPITCRVYGINQFNKEQKEDILIMNGHNIYTRKQWKRIEAIEFSNLNGVRFEYELLQFRNPETPVYDLKELNTFEDTRESIIWTCEQRGNGTVFQKNITIGINSGEVLRNAGAITTVQEIEALDVDNVSRLMLKDIAVDKFSNLIYSIDDKFLYIHDKREPYPEILKQIHGDNGISDFILEMDSDELGLDENGEKEILFKCIHKRPGKTIIKYRIKLKKPDGTISYINQSGKEISNLNEAIIYVSQKDITLDERQYSLRLNQIGNYILELEAVYKGGYTSSHKQLIRIIKTGAMVKYKLERILGDAIPVSLFFDYDQKLKIYTNDEKLHTITLRKDGVLIDYENKILYFSEEYSSIDVE